MEGTRDFNLAYDKLVKKFYHEEGANLLIPEEDMMLHEYNKLNKVKVNVEERQKRIEEQQRKKEDKIRQAQYEKEMKEMQECSFAPKIYTKKKPRKMQNSMVPESNVQS